MSPYRLHGTLLPGDDAPRDLWVSGGRIAFEAVAGAEHIGPANGYILPGLVDCHVHLTMDFADYGLPPGSKEIVDRGRADHLRSGTLLLRDIGTLNMAATVGRDADGLPPVHGAGNLLAPPGRYFGVERPATPEDVAGIAMEQVEAGARWVKLIGDWCLKGTDFSRTALNYPDETMRLVVAQVHAAGARVAVHCTSRDALSQAIGAGVDSIEHGVGMDESLLRDMATQGIAWTPTAYIQPAVIEMVSEFGPDAIRMMHESFEATNAAIPRAASLGVRVLAGTDMAPPGSVWREVAILFKLGLTPNDAIAAATTTAREFLGEPALEQGAPADLVVYEHDPRNDPEVLSRPALVMFRGRVIS